MYSLTKIGWKRGREGREEEKEPSLFHEAGIILTPRPDKNSTRKENYRLISLMSIKS